MSEQKHTPGPWQAAEPRKNEWMITTPAVYDCAQWLRAHLLPPQNTSGTFGDPNYGVASVYRAAKSAGFSRRLVRLAKQRLQLVVTSKPGNEGKRVWYWRLP